MRESQTSCRPRLPAVPGSSLGIWGTKPHLPLALEIWPQFQDKRKGPSQQSPGAGSVAAWGKPREGFWENMGEREVPECAGQCEREKWSQQKEGRCQRGVKFNPLCRLEPHNENLRVSPLLFVFLYKKRLLRQRESCPSRMRTVWLRKLISETRARPRRKSK